MANISGTSGNDSLVGTAENDHIHGHAGNDTIIGNGGQDHISAGAGDDRVIHHGRGGGIYGGAGNDYLEASKTGYGQFHIWGDTGNDRIVMSLTNNSGWGSQAYHVYGGEGADRFEFTNAGSTNLYSFTRIDDFDASRDSIWVNGQQLNLNALPANMRIVNYVGQQFLLIGSNVVIALEGARLSDEFSGFGVSQGEEAHFWSMTSAATGFPTAIFNQPTVAFIDQVNFVPYATYSAFDAGLNRIATDGVANGVSVPVNGSAAGDYIWVWDSALTSNVINGLGGNDVIDANTGRDTVYGGDGDDLIAGGIDRDTLYGDNGNDQIWGGSQNDVLFGGAGNDRLHGGTGNDVLNGGLGNDTLHGDEGHDLLRGDDGNDNMGGLNGNDTLFGGAGNDIVNGNDGNDDVRGDDGNDNISGQNGNDRLYGGTGNDTLTGGNDNDSLWGDAGNDSLVGGAGNDRIQGGAGRDSATGSSGNDVFVFQTGDMTNWGATTGTTAERMAQLDLITDFVIGQDKIHFAGISGITSVSDFTVWQYTVGTNVHFAMSHSATGQRILVDVADTVTWSQFTASTNFIFS
ncbi:calcium-binding protein [Tabrizicola sp.]|uniref:calcium-binding protein n=1 Tax=Tabrizicola sp. TaxID=2005166 RepID=UPI003D282BBF